MKLTRGEFCQFSHETRFKLLKEFGRNILKKKVKMKLVSVYKISDFYVEVYEDRVSRRLEKVEPVKNIQILEVYHRL